MWIITNGNGWYLGETRYNTIKQEQETDLTTEEAKARRFETEAQADAENRACGLVNDGYYPEEL